jgi:hypothetical protein
MLDSKKDYRGMSVEVFNTGLKEIDGKQFKIIWQGKAERYGLLFELNVSNPKARKTEALCIKESQCKIL